VTRLALAFTMTLVACSSGDHRESTGTETAPATTAPPSPPDCAALVRNAQAELAALSLTVGPCAADADCIVRQAPDCCCLGPVVIPRANEYGWDQAASLSCDAYCDDRCSCAADFLPVRAVCAGGSCRAAPL